MKSVTASPTDATKASYRIEQAVKAADKDGDGKLSRDEYPQKNIFDAVDANKDGLATIDEIKAYYARNRAKAAPKTPMDPKP